MMSMEAVYGSHGCTHVKMAPQPRTVQPQEQTAVLSAFIAPSGRNGAVAFFGVWFSLPRPVQYTPLQMRVGPMLIEFACAGFPGCTDRAAVAMAFVAARQLAEAVPRLPRAAECIEKTAAVPMLLGNTCLPSTTHRNPHCSDPSWYPQPEQDRASPLQPLQQLQNRRLGTVDGRPTKQLRSLQQPVRAGPPLIAPQLPQHRGRLVVVLDLDETLVHFRNGPVHYRPHLGELLDALKHTCEVVLWTASTAACAQRIMGQLDPRNDRFHHRVFRTDRWFKGLPYQKNLRALGRDLRRCVIVENSVDCVSQSSANAVIVKDYFGGQDDQALAGLKKLLLDMAASDVSVQEYLSKTPHVAHALRREVHFYALSDTDSMSSERASETESEKDGSDAAM
eukprot:TRINITY_DN8896_c2_g1_i2.p2 TRINITY_DN8896_c2_g1~~TRINITY_DN8896_c2_g1_i2.p2  ORF type:complete len:393 (+),score=121.81 TRINITY_DN8896_c2_g1_i2:340-1518(+)